ncbi:hypothetical protein TIFTF001_017613 [Ficus carica]|uniref:Uncharacterized protein n=1 Tax=Ficus carica TaxID=3494 RepID=A0AA88DJ25_FICCA|nr:hypothetical protein TIFTF001_017613 [Ficus carica]
MPYSFFALAVDLDAFNSFPWGVLSWEATRLPGFPHALLVWAYETIPSIATKFTTKYEPAIPRMTSWTTTENVKFNDVVAAFTTLGEDEHTHFVLLPTEEELNNPWIARLFSKSATAMALLPPPKSSVTRPSTDTKSEWREFQTEIRGQVASLNKKLEDLKKEQKQSNKLLRRLIKLLFANKSEKGEGKADSAPPVSSGHEINAERDELDARKTTSPDIGSVADIGVQAAMEFLTADKVIVSHEDAENDRNQINHCVKFESASYAEFVPTKQVDEGERIPEGEGEGIETKDEKVEEQLVSKIAELGNDESSDVVETSGDVIPKKKRARLSRLGQCLARLMIDVGSPSTAPPKQLNALPRGLDDEPPKETLEEFREWIKKGLLKKLHQVRRFVECGVCTRVHLKHSTGNPVTLYSSSCLALMYKVHEGPHNSKVRGGVDALSKFIPLLAERLSLFEFKPREPPGTYPIPVTIMADIPRQDNGEWMACYLWGHARRKLEGDYKSDDEVDTDY